MSRIALSFVLVSLTAFALAPADVRPASVRGQMLDPERGARAAALIARGVEAQGGWAAWQRLGALEVEMTDRWAYSPFRMYVSLAENETRVRGEMRLHDYGRNSRYTITSGAQRGRSFGVADGAAFEGERPAGVGVRFFAPTMQFLPTLAFRAASAEVATFVDEVERQGQVYDRVLITWGDPEAPSARIDQYLLYYARGSGRLTHVECTVRDFGPVMTGFISYEGWTEVEGVTLPADYSMGLFRLGGPRVHRVTLDEVRALTR